MITPSLGGRWVPHVFHFSESFTGNTGHSHPSAQSSFLNSIQVSSPALTASELQAPDYS